MVRVQKVTGPASAVAGEQVVYRIAAFAPPDPPAAETADVSWLVKTPSGAALTHLPRHGPELRLTVPESWTGQTAIVMPYLHAPSAAVSVTTAVGARADTLPVVPGGARRLPARDPRQPAAADRQAQPRAPAVPAA